MDVVAHAGADPLVEVGHLGQPGVVEVDGLVDLAAQQGRGGGVALPWSKWAAQPLVAAAVGLVKDGVVFVGGVVEGLAVVVDEGGPAEHGADVGVLLQVLQLALSCREEQVVGVEDGDVAPAGAADGVVHGDAGATVLREGRAG